MHPSVVTDVIIPILPKRQQRHGRAVTLRPRGQSLGSRGALLPCHTASPVDAEKGM